MLSFPFVQSFEILLQNSFFSSGELYSNHRLALSTMKRGIGSICDCIGKGRPKSGLE